MKCVSEYFVQELTYKYENELERDMHKKHMLSKGFTDTSYLLINKNALVVRYEKRQLNDRIARL
jgi:hypothetical protein